ncbi:tetratricopeptide repeat protein [Streptomyces sp. NPDC048018]|uniref:tetratricopeptide repeat protein n=1 Tax=Streptomyces sp. NPDC048018 TaxID=3365499 RepID=UPI00371DD2C1
MVTNYVTASLPGWAGNPRLVWSVFGGLAVVALVLQLWGRRLDAAQTGSSVGRPIAVSRIVSDAAESLRPPSIDRPVRGREATISDLQRLLRRSRAANRIAVVTGTGGMGKTTVAAALARKAQDQGTPVFWVPALNASELAEHMVRVAVACGLPEEVLESARAGRVSLADAVWEQLAESKEWLIVLDNLDDPDIARSGSGPLHDYRGWVRCPGPGGLLLITSRVSDQGTWGGGSSVVRLAPLPDEDGAQVLLDAAPRAGSQEEAELLAKRLGGLPLALRAAARYVAAPSSRHHTFEGYRRALETELASLIGAESPQASDPETARTVVRLTWDLSLDHLADNGIVLARPVLRLLSFLAWGPVPVSFVTPELVTEATGLPATRSGVDAAFDGLSVYGLLDVPTDASGASVPGLVDLHPLVREITALDLTQRSDTLQAWHTALARRISLAIADVAEAELSDRAVARHLFPHLLVIAALGENRGNLNLAQAVVTLADVLHQERDHEHVLLLSQLLREAWSEGMGPDHPNTLTAAHNVAITLGYLSQHQNAAEMHRQNLGTRLQVLGPDHADTLASRDGLAVSLGALGDLDEALSLLEQNYQVSDRVFGRDHPQTLGSRHSLARVMEERGEFRRAAALFRENLHECARVLGRDHPYALASQSGLAYALSGLGDEEGAVSLLRQNLDACLRVFGPDHSDTLVARSNLAHGLEELGEYGEAVDLHERNLAGRLRVLGADHPDTRDSQDALARARAALAPGGIFGNLLRRVRSGGSPIA